MSGWVENAWVALRGALLPSTVHLRATTVGRIGDREVSVGSTFTDEYTLHDGRSWCGPVIRLRILDTDISVLVGAGSELTVDQATFIVVRIEPSDKGLDLMVLKPANFLSRRRVVLPPLPSKDRVVGTEPSSGDLGSAARAGPDQVVIESTTVGRIDDVAVSMGHLYQGTHTLHDGTKRHGPMCTLVVAPGGERLELGVGSEARIGGEPWIVLAFDRPEGENPSVVLGRSRTVDKTLVSPPEPEIFLLWDEDLDMLFNSECTLCSGPAGWDGRTMLEDGDMCVAQKCTQCGQTFWASDGALLEQLEKTPPTFTPGRKREPQYAKGPTRQLTEAE
jgi:hypothetical protein